MPKTLKPDTAKPYSPAATSSHPDAHRDFSRPLRLTIAMTSADVASGTPGERCGCALVLATDRATGLFSRVTNHYITLHRSARSAALDRDVVAVCATPRVAQEFITVYDGAYWSGMLPAPAPITFSIEFQPASSEKEVSLA